MELTVAFILSHYSHVFKNEFNSRKILHTFHDAVWGSYVAMHYCSNTWDFQTYGREYYDNKCKRLRALTRTLVLTEDKNGKIELFQFWKDFEKAQFGYCQIIDNSPLTNDWYEYHRIVNPVYTIELEKEQKKIA
jgi:hypothetical protein